MNDNQNAFKMESKKCRKISVRCLEVLEKTPSSLYRSNVESVWSEGRREVDPDLLAKDWCFLFLFLGWGGGSAGDMYLCMCRLLYA